MERVKRNFRSDFQCKLVLRDGEGAEVLFPGFDWRATFWTQSKVFSYEASCIGGVLTNAWIDEEGRLHIAFDNHGLRVGQVNVDFEVIWPDGEYPDGNQRVVSPMPLNLELVKEPTEITEAEVELTLPVLIRWAQENEMPVFGEILDRINEKLEEILGGGGNGGGGSAVEAAAGPRTLQRGMISTGAMPGVVYRNLGYIRVPFKREPGAEVAVDVSGVDLDCVEGVSCASGYDWAELDRERKAMRIRFRNIHSEFNPYIRLKLKENWLGKEGIMRCGDGLIRPVGLGFEPIERRVEAPRIPQGLVNNCSGLGEVVMKLFPGRTMDVEYKYYHDLRGSLHWKKVRWVNRGWRRRCGVARVRYSRVHRRMASEWAVFTFCQIGNDTGSFSVRPL